MTALRHLDLFSGIGGFALAVRWLGHETVGFCEIDEWSRRVLDKHWPGVPKHDDIRTLKGTEFGPVDLITGGFPCQPFSFAGKRRGEEDDRHLWPAMLRIVDTARPRFVLGENVPGIVNMALDGVLSDLESIGYTAGAVVIPAGAVNALHRRDRVWIMAHCDESTTPERGECSIATGKDSERRYHRIGGRADDWQVADGGAGENPKCVAHGNKSDASQPSGENQPGNEATLQQQWVRLRDESGRDGFIQPTSNADTNLRIQKRNTPESEQVPVSRGNNPSRCCSAQPERGAAEAPRALDAGPDGLSPGLVRSRWADGSWELDLPRVVTDEPDRRQKLMAAGNAIVPQVAYEILREMIGEAA